MIPTDAIMATAVVSAPTSTAVRRSEPFMLRAASIASTPSTLRRMPSLMPVNPCTSAGMANAEAATSSSAAA